MDHAELRRELVAMAGSLTNAEIAGMKREAHRRGLTVTRWARGMLVSQGNGWTAARGSGTQHARNTVEEPDNG